MRENLSDMLAREVKDPRVREAGLLSVNYVELNADMSVARVFVSFYGQEDGPDAVASAMAGLRAAAGFLRGPVARRLNLARSPELRFVHDTSPEFWQRLDEIARDDERRAEEAVDDVDREQPE
jgi:ribosome-binding factor A